ncbi:MAG: aminotransferase class I/II-fold pyridoxal phosphate-dependent enzyme [Bryobacterales bacterium]|nr:aminotransferase class I/II-fold pyridoxal phosphate-dependent enzyme [Bryobacterales bacterium]
MNTPKPDSTRRTFVKASGGALAAASFAAHAATPLAMSGGAATVTFPANRHTYITKWPRYGVKEKEALHAVIDKNTFYDEAPQLEKEWKAYTKTPYCKTHCNGTSALTSMFFALDLPPGSEILVPSYTFFATAAPMRFFGYVPVFVDIDPKTACFDLDDAKKKLSKHTKALCVMHSWGLPCEMDKISDFAKEKGLILLEDAAHAHGATMQGKFMGTWGAIGAYSFQASKVMPAIEGGMGMYQTREYFERAAALGHYEDPPKFAADSPVRKYDGTGFGLKFRIHPMGAALARQQLMTLDERNARVISQVRKLNDRLTALPGLMEPRQRADQKRVYYYANMLLLDEKKAGMKRDALVKALKAEGVRATTWVYPEQHKFAIYSEAKWWHHPPPIPKSMPGDDHINNTHLFVPLFYEEVPELVDQYVAAFEKVWAHRKELS